jgi:hypothetical protein
MVADRLHPTAAVLFAHALSSLAEAHASYVEAHVAQCRRCTQQMKLMTQDISFLPLALEPSPVPPLIKESLLHSLSEIHRLYDSAGPIAEMLAISRLEAHGVLDMLDSGAAWRQLHRFWVADLPAVRNEPAMLARVPGGVRLRPGLLSTSPADGGAQVPLRQIMILQGGGRDNRGTLWQTGDHRQGILIDSLLAHPGPDLIAVIIRAVPRSNRSPRPCAMVSSAPGP